MSFTKTYFLCPTSDFIHPPPTGPLSLGSIIRSTSTPNFPLNRSNTVPVANENPVVLENDWKKTVSLETARGLGVYAQFLQLATGGLGLGPEANAEHSSRTANMFAFDSVTTVSFEPSIQYVEEAVKTPAVQTWLREPKQRFSPFVSLFLVTGIKTVKGAKIKFSNSGNKSITANIGIEMAPLGMSFGPKGHWSSAIEEETEFSRDSEFVFAFSVKRLKIGRKPKIKEHNKGAFLATGNDGEEDGESMLVEEIDGSEIESARLVPDPSENGNVYCIAT